MPRSALAHPAGVPDSAPPLADAIADRERLEELLRPRLAGAYALARRVTGHADLAEDAVQEAVLRLLRGRGYDGRVPFDAWFGRLVSCAALDERRRRARRARLHPPMAADAGVAPSGGDPEAIETVRQALDALPERYRRALVLRYVAGLTQEEAAQALGVPPGTMAARLSRGRERLRESLGEEWSAALGVLAALPAPQPPDLFARAMALRAAPAPIASAAMIVLGGLAALVVVAALAVAPSRGAPAAPAPPPRADPPRAVAAVWPTRLCGEPDFACSGTVNTVAFSGDGRLLACGTADGVQVWDPASHRRQWSTLAGSAISACRFTSDGARLIALGGEVVGEPPKWRSQVAVIDAATGAVVRAQPVAQDLWFESSAVLAADDGTLLYAGGLEATAIEEMDVRSGAGGRGIAHPFGDAGDDAENIQTLRFSQDGRELACLGRRTLAIWRWPERTLRAAWKLPEEARTSTVPELTWTSDGRRLIVTRTYRPAEVGEHERDSLVLASDDGHLIERLHGLACLVGDEVDLLAHHSLSATSGEGWRLDDVPASAWVRLVVSPDGRWLAAALGGVAEVPLLVDLATKRLVAPAPDLPESPPEWIGFADDGRLLTRGGQSLRMWFPDGRSAGCIEGCTDAPAMRGRTAIVPVFENRDPVAARVVDLADGRTIGHLARHYDPMCMGEGINGAWLSPDGRLALTASQDGTCIVSDLRDGRGLATFDGMAKREDSYIVTLGIAAWRFAGGLAYIAQPSWMSDDDAPLVGGYDPATWTRTVIFRFADGEAVRSAWLDVDDGGTAYLMAQRGFDTEPLASGDGTREVTRETVHGLWDARTGAFLRAVDDPGHQARFARGGSLLVSSEAVVAVADGKTLRRFPPADTAVLSPSGTLRASLSVAPGSAEARLEVADAVSGIAIASQAVSLPAPRGKPRPGPDGPVAPDAPLLAWSAGEDALAVAMPPAIGVLRIGLFDAPGGAAADAASAERALGEADAVAAGKAIAGLVAAPDGVARFRRLIAGPDAIAARRALHGLEWLARRGDAAARGTLGDLASASPDARDAQARLAAGAAALARWAEIPAMSAPPARPGTKVEF